MSIKRYVASKDSTITDAFQSNLRTRGTGSNMGESDILETFSIFGQASSASVEKSRILVEFPISSIISDRADGKLAASGSVEFIMKLSNARHGETLPRQFTLTMHAVSQSWEEGTGLDMEEYTDLTKNGPGVNWVNARSGVAWAEQGGDFLTASYVPGSTMPSFSQFFDRGIEDLEINVTSLVEEWISGTHPNYGVGIFLSGTQEDGSDLRSYFTKRFFARGSEFFYKKPYIEARWDSTLKDDRGKVVIDSPLLSTADKTNTLYLYNYVFGALKDIPSIGSDIFVELWTSASAGTQIVTSPSPITGTKVSTGIYSASFVLPNTASLSETVYDRWFSGSVALFTGSFEPESFNASQNALQSRRYVISLTNMKPIYSNEETPRLRLFTRLKDFQSTIYVKATTTPENNIIEDAYYKVFRVFDNCDIIPYGTGSLNHTRLSYDKDGNYFDLDLSLLEPGFMYGIKLVFAQDGKFEEQKQTFKFRIDQLEEG